MTTSGSPAQLTIRVGVQDVALVRRVFGLEGGASPARHRPGRLVVDAHVPLGPGAELASLARQAGVGFLVDPETTYLQDVQCADAPWARVPWARTGVHTPADMTPALQDELVRTVVDYQVSHGASAVIAPYVHIDRPDGLGLAWARVQAEMWRRTARYLESAAIHLPVVAVVAVGWRCLHPIQGIRPLEPMLEALRTLNPDEVALAASKVHLGAHPSDRIAELLQLVRRLSSQYKLTMWQQGVLGEACVIEGASGYECGVGWREKCDLQSKMAGWRSPRNSGPTSPRSVYIHELGRSVPKRRLEVARQRRDLWPYLVCTYPDCCAPGGTDLIGDARLHTIVARARDLDSLNGVRATRWGWHQLVLRLERGVVLAERMNALGPGSRDFPAVDVNSLRALFQVAHARRGRRGLRRSA